MIHSTVAIVEGTAEAKGLDLHVRIDPELSLNNLGDGARIRQILLNLLSNAVKFTSRGSVSLDVSKIPSLDPANEHLRFAVSDTGPGVPAEGQERLFEQFAQADPSISREHGGTGLGLSICKSLVELMGGRIGFDCNKGSGCTFWFEIELATADGAAVTPQLPSYPANRGAVRIVLVEDLPMNQELACVILRRAGHFVDVAGDGMEAIAAVEGHAYDVILMDVQIPRMDGVTATRIIRQIDGPARHTPIIAMTANALPEQVRAFRQAGMDDYIAKPFKQQDLHEAIRRVVDLPLIAEPPVSATGRVACRS